MIFVVRRPDGSPIAAIPVEGDAWGEAEKWAYLAALADRPLSTEPTPQGGT